VAHASIVTFDIYKPYINPLAEDKKLKFISHASLIFFSIFSASFSTALWKSGVSMGWMLEFVGVVCGAAVVPITLAITTSRVSPLYMMISAPVGTVAGIAAWLGTTKGVFGAINLTTTFDNWSMFAGCATSLCLPMVIWLVMFPTMKLYDWENLFRMVALDPRPGDVVHESGDVSDLGHEWDAVALKAAGVRAKWISGVLCLIFLGKIYSLPISRPTNVTTSHHTIFTVWQRIRLFKRLLHWLVCIIVFETTISYPISHFLSRFRGPGDYRIL
jgi:hypothetical protein